MRSLGRILTGGAFCIACFLPPMAWAITGSVTSDDPVTVSDPPPDTNVDDDPVVVSDPPPTVIITGDKNIDEDDRLGDKNKENKVTDKKVVVVPVPKPQVKTYPVRTSNNFCPVGLQPVTVNGSISCGRPTTTVTYQQMKRHPQAVRVHRPARQTYHRSAVPSCTPGLKGCSDR